MLRKHGTQLTKEAIGKSKIKGDKFPKFMTINKKEIIDKNRIANSFNDYFVNIGSNFPAKIRMKNILVILCNKPIKYLLIKS